MQKTLALIMVLAACMQGVAPAVEGTLPDAPPAQATEISWGRPLEHPFPEASSPSEQLNAAQQLQAAGHYEQAIQAYKLVIAATPADSVEHMAAGFSLGQTCYDAGRYPEAVAALGDFVDAYPNDSRSGPAILLRGRSYQAMSSWSEAISQYQKYLSVDQTITSFVYELMGDCYAAVKKYEAAAEVYDRALNGPVDQPMKLHLLEDVANAQISDAKYDAAVTTYDAMLQESQDASYRAKAEYLAGQALAVSGKVADSYVRYRRAVDNYPKAQYAYRSLIELVNSGQVVNELQRGVTDYYGGAYSPAIQALERFLKTKPTGHVDEASYYLGLSYQALARYALSIQSFDTIIAQYPNSANQGDAWIAKGKALAGQGKLAEAIEVLTQFAQRYPSHALAPEALWLCGTQLEEQGNFKAAAEAYTKVQAQYPQSVRAPTALHQAGLCAFRTQQTDTAVQAWQKLADGYKDSPLRPAALFWLAKLYHATGNDDRSGNLLREIKATYPGDYYAARADEFAETWQAKLFQRSTQQSMLLAAPTAAEQAEAEQWLLSWVPVKPPEDTSVSNLSDAIAKGGRLRRGVLLWQVDLTSDASAQLRGLKADWNDSPLELYQLGLYLNDKGLFRVAISCLNRVVELAPLDKRTAVPSFLLKLTHPVHFSDLIVAEAVNRQVDPLLVLAMVRQESAFEWNAGSWVGAQGLMQIMPTTGDWIALKLSATDYSAGTLLRPYLNVRFGVWYIAQQLAAFDGDVAASLAAYNAGPGRIVDWQTDEMSQDDDLFLEYMPLSEPQLYVRQIYLHYSMYRKLYANH